MVNLYFLEKGLFFFNFCLAAPWPTLDHYHGDSLNHPKLITTFLQLRPRNEAGSLSPAERLAGFESGTFLF